MTTGCAFTKFVDIEKSFNGVPVLAGVTTDVREGEVLGLIGPNGSGKTTLASILSGALRPDAGQLWVQGELQHFANPAAALAEGIRVLPQSLEVYASLSVLENIFVGQEITIGLFPVQFMAWGAMRAKAKMLLDRVGAGGVDVSRRTGDLSGGQQRAVTLARLLAVDGRVLIFDEPATGLGIHQKDRLFATIRALAAEGRSVILISHDIDDLLAVCDRVVGLRQGKISFDVPSGDADRTNLALHMSAS